jgi:hypothetical protein
MSLHAVGDTSAYNTKHSGVFNLEIIALSLTQHVSMRVTVGEVRGA